MNETKKIFVFADWYYLEAPTLMGVLQADAIRGKEVFSFQYDKAWLSSPNSQMIDPELQLYAGKQYLDTSKKANFGVFTDSSPDRWGRVLMRRREAALAHRYQRHENALFESDYLLGVFDAHRMGALRFKTSTDGPFLSDEKDLATPPFTAIRTLEEISLRLEDDRSNENPDYLKWLMLLMAPGSSLGGARPKASVVDTNGNLWIAKFPSKHDQNDAGAWEMVLQELAISCKIEMAESQAKKFYSDKHTFLTKRFDRRSNGGRVHFSSAMTLLGYADGADAHIGASYLELVEFISMNSCQVTEDLEQLWRRVVFNICTSNTDDHLRNHGFLLTPRGWKLSPAYDLNPVETANGLTLNITENNNALDLALAVKTAPLYRIGEQKALEIIREMSTKINNWRNVAKKYGLSRQEQELKARAFRGALEV